MWHQLLIDSLKKKTVLTLMYQDVWSNANASLLFIRLYTLMKKENGCLNFSLRQLCLCSQEVIEDLVVFIIRS